MRAREQLYDEFGVFISSRSRSEKHEFNRLISVVFHDGLKDNKQFLCGKNSGREEVVDSLLLLVTAHSTSILSFPVYQLQSNKKETKVFEMKPLDFTAVLRSQSSHTSFLGVGVASKSRTKS